VRARTFLSGLIVSLAMACAAWAQQEEPDVQQAVLDELRQLRQQIEELNRKIEELQGRLDKVAAGARSGRPSGLPDDWKQRGPDREALGKITLPENPTKDHVREYVARITQVSQRQSVFSSDDPQVPMLVAVGPEHLDVLLEAATRGDFFGPYHILEAVKRVAGAQHKQMILDALPHQHELAAVVLARGWATDARETLLAELRAAPQYLPTEWIHAVASLRDPETYDELKRCLIFGGNRAATYDAIRFLPGIELEDAVASAWGLAGIGESYEARSMARIAIGYGHVDALETLIAELDLCAEDPFALRQVRAALLRHTEARGTNEEMRRWFEEHRDDLVFDPEHKLFRVRTGDEDQPGSDTPPRAGAR